MGLITDRIRDIRTLPNIDGATSNVITQGNIAVEATTPTKNFAAVTYTGKGTSQDIVTGISSVDFTVASNGSGYWLEQLIKLRMMLV